MGKCETNSGWAHHFGKKWLSGIGIPAEDHDRVLNECYRVDKSHSKAIGGTGLGLSIVKHSAAYHNAPIELESAPRERNLHPPDLSTQPGNACPKCRKMSQGSVSGTLLQKRTLTAICSERSFVMSAFQTNLFHLFVLFLFFQQFFPFVKQFLLVESAVFQLVAFIPQKQMIPSAHFSGLAISFSAPQYEHPVSRFPLPLP